MKTLLLRITSVIMTLFVLLCLSSCTASPSSDTLAYKLLKLYPKLPPCIQYSRSVSYGEYGYLSSEDFSYLYVGRKETLPEFDMIEDFRIILSSSDRPFELHVIKVYSSSDTNEIKKLLEKRAALIRYHNKTELSYRSYEPSVFTVGKYAVLAVTEDNEAIKLMLKKIL